jgi:hypothetical protein
MDAHLTVLDTGHHLDRDDPHGWLNAVSNVAARARRVPRTPAEQAELGGDARWRYGAFVTNTPTGQVQYLDARHRTQAHVEDRIKELKACGATRLPSTSYTRNSAWLQLSAHAVTLLAWTRLLGMDGDLATAEPKTLRFRVLAAPARYARHARRRVLKIPTGWAWQTTWLEPGTGSPPCTPPDPRAPVPTSPQHPRTVEPGAHPRRHPGLSRTPEQNYPPRTPAGPPAEPTTSPGPPP